MLSILSKPFIPSGSSFTECLATFSAFVSRSNKSWSEKTLEYPNIDLDKSSQPLTLTKYPNIDLDKSSVPKTLIENEIKKLPCLDKSSVPKPLIENEIKKLPQLPQLNGSDYSIYKNNDPKTELKNYCWKHFRVVPIYSHFESRSTIYVTFSDKRYGIRSPACNSAKLADKIASIAMLNFFNTNRYSLAGLTCERSLVQQCKQVGRHNLFCDTYIPKMTCEIKQPLVKAKSDQKIAVFIDIENLNLFAKHRIEISEMKERVAEKLGDNITIYVVASMSNWVNFEKKVPSYATALLSPSAEFDSADICMQMYIGGFLMKEEYDTYVILTKDHFGRVAKSLIECENLMWKRKTALVLHTISTFWSCMSELAE
jgi:hypothetical protein